MFQEHEGGVMGGGSWGATPLAFQILKQRPGVAQELSGLECRKMIDNRNRGRRAFIFGGGGGGSIQPLWLDPLRPQSGSMDRAPANHKRKGVHAERGRGVGALHLRPGTGMKHD